MKYKCPDCGRINLGMYCDTCNRSLSSACAVSGEESSDETRQDAVSIDTLYRMEEEKKRRRIIIIAAVLIAVVLLLVLSMFKSSGSQNFSEMFPDYASNSWCTISSDGSWMSMDTNPLDIDPDKASGEKSFVYSAVMSSCLRDIEKVNEKLGFSSALMQKMNTTTWSMGRQSDSNNKYSVSWTYHPDKGLEVMYEIKK